MSSGGRVLAVWISLAALFAAGAAAHPGAGIVVDAQGAIIFADGHTGIWKIDTQGQITRISKRSYHWLAIDAEGHFFKSRLDQYNRISPKGSKPALLAGNDRPIVVGLDKNLYHAACHFGGPLLVMRVKPDGERFVLADVPADGYTTRMCPVNGIAVTPEGSVYFTEPQSVTKVSKEGTISPVAGPVTVSDCAPVAGVIEGWKPFLRGLAADSSGTVYVAASGCGVVLKIAPGGATSTVLKAESPWSPTAVAISGRDLIVLESVHSTKSSKPAVRVRKVSADGAVTVVGTLGQP